MGEWGHRMYRLLLVTDRQAVRDTFSGIPSWEALGFKVPRMMDSCESAMDCLSRHHADVIAVNLEEEERIRLFKALDAYPHLPIMMASENPEETLRNLKEAEQVLGILHLDYSNDPQDMETQMLLARHDFFRHFFAEGCTDEAKIRRKLRLMRSRMDPDRRCVVIQLEVEGIADYLESRWHYGVDRLEVAIRNIFGAQEHGVRMLLSMSNDDTAYIVACPMLGTPSIEDEALLQMTEEHTASGISHVEDYLGLRIRKKDTVILNSLLELPAATRKMHAQDQFSA